MDTTPTQRLRRVACTCWIVWLCSEGPALAQPDDWTRPPQRPGARPAGSVAPVATHQERQYRFFGTLEYHGAGQARFQCDVALRWQCRHVSAAEVRYEVDFDSVPGNEVDTVVGDDRAYHGCRPARKLCLSRDPVTQFVAGEDALAQAWAAWGNDLLGQVRKHPAGEATPSLRLRLGRDLAQAHAVSEIAFRGQRRVVRLESGATVVGAFVESLPGADTYAGLWLFDADLTELLFHAGSFETSKGGAGGKERIRCHRLLVRMSPWEEERSLWEALPWFRCELEAACPAVEPLRVERPVALPPWVAEAILPERAFEIGGGLWAERKTNPAFLAAAGMFYAADSIASALLGDYQGLWPTVGQWLGAELLGTEDGAKLGELAGELVPTPSLIGNLGKAVKLSQGPRALLDALQVHTDRYDLAEKLVKGSQAAVLGNKIYRESEAARERDQALDAALDRDRRLHALDQSLEATLSRTKADPIGLTLGDLLTQAGAAYNGSGPSPRAWSPNADTPRSPFEFSDPGADFSSRPAGPTASGLGQAERESADTLDQASKGLDGQAPSPAAPPTPTERPAQPLTDAAPETPGRTPASRTPIPFQGPDESIRVPTPESWQREMAWRIESVNSIGQQPPRPAPPVESVTVRKADLWRADNREYVNGRELNILSGRDGALQQARSVPADTDRRIHETIARWHQEFIAAAGLRAPPEYGAIRALHGGKSGVNYTVAGYAQLAQP